METKQVILLGPPGVEVGAQATALAERWRIPHVSMQALLHQAIANAAIGAEVKAAVEAGPIPDVLAMTLLRRRLEQPDAMLQGWVLEGFPRSLGQAQALDAWLSAVGQPAAAVVHLKATTGILINRLSAEKEKYESTSAIRRALDRHQEEVAPLLAYYQERSPLETVNGSLPFREVANALARVGQVATGAAELIEDEAELDSRLARQSRLVVNCTASWCGSCKQVTPLVDKLAETYRGRVEVVKIDFDANTPITKRFGLKGIPAVMLFEAGELVETLIGVKSYEAYSAAVERLLQ